jgi:hypothetical protein
MKRIYVLLVAAVMLAGIVTAWARTSTRAYAEPAPQSAAESAPQSAKEVRGATPYFEIKNEPPPRQAWMLATSSSPVMSSKTWRPSELEIEGAP